jgi:hypothetical protein
MKGNLREPPMVDTPQAHEGIHAPEKAFHRRAFVVQGGPLGGISQNPRMLSESQCPKVSLVPMWYLCDWLLLAASVYFDDGERAHFVGRSLLWCPRNSPHNDDS